MMRRVMVQYRVKPDRIAEHESLIRAVFEELVKKAPGGIRYGAFKQADGVSFVHIAFVDAEGHPLDAIDAFKAFTERIKDRCEQVPATSVLSDVGAYGF
jgi:quinol monooxygenase YgiN